MLNAARKKLLKSRLEVLKLGKNTDCVFLAGNDETAMEIHAVKAMMMMTSGFMQGMFDSPLCPPNPIRIDSVEPKILQLIVEFVHLTELITPVNCEDAISLAIAADQLIIDSLREYSISLIQEQINPSNIWLSLDKLLAYNLNDVAEAACSMILQARTIECLEMENFGGASTASVIFLLQQTELALNSEAQLINYCIEWASQQENDNDLLSLIPHMRLLTFSPSDAAHFCKCLKLTNEERAAILEFTITQQLPQEFPTTLCAFTVSRIFPFREFEETIIPEFLTVSKTTDSLTNPDVILFTSNSYAIVNKISLSLKRNIFLTGFSGLGLMMTNEGIEFNSKTGVYETKKAPNTKFSCSVSIKGLGKDVNFDLHNLPHDKYWTVKLEQPLLLKKSAGEHNVTVHFRPQISCNEYYMKNIVEDDVSEALEKSSNSDIFNSLKVSWTLDYHSGRSFGPHGPIFLKSFNYVIDPDYAQIRNE